MGRRKETEPESKNADDLAPLEAELAVLPECAETALARKYLAHVRGGRNVPTDRHTLECLIAEAKRKAEAG